MLGRQRYLLARLLFEGLGVSSSSSSITITSLRLGIRAMSLVNCVVACLFWWPERRIWADRGTWSSELSLRSLSDSCSVWLSSESAVGHTWGWRQVAGGLWRAEPESTDGISPASQRRLESVADWCKDGDSRRGDREECRGGGECRLEDCLVIATFSEMGINVWSKIGGIVDVWSRVWYKNVEDEAEY